MASSKSESGIQDIVSCSVCTEQYDSDVHVPNILPCEHTFCATCIHTMAKGNMFRHFSCPVCRKAVPFSFHTLTVNRVVLEIVEELKKPAANVVKCAEHGNVACDVVCIDCLVGLCYKCLMATNHHSHHLEELAKAKPLLTQKLKKLIKQQQDAVELKAVEIDDSPYSMAEIENAQADVQSVCARVQSAIGKWKNKQFAVLQNLRQEVVLHENEIKDALITLKSFENCDTDANTLLEKIKQAEAHCPNALKPLKLPEENDYDLNARYLGLVQTLRSLPISEYLFSSKLLKNRSTATRRSISPSSTGEDTDHTDNDVMIDSTLDVSHVEGIQRRGRSRCRWSLSPARNRPRQRSPRRTPSTDRSRSPHIRTVPSEISLLSSPGQSQRQRSQSRSSYRSRSRSASRSSSNRSRSRSLSYDSEPSFH